MKRGFRQRTASVLLAACAAAALARSTSAATPEEPAPAWLPATYSDLGSTALTLHEALRLTLENNPQIRLEQSASRFQEGLLQEALGLFDGSLNGELTYERSRERLRASVLKEERDRRDRLRARIASAEEELLLNEAILAEVIAVQEDPTGHEISDPDLAATLRLINNFIDNADSEEERAELTAERDLLLANARETYTKEAARYQGLFDERTTELANIGEVPTEEELAYGKLNLQYLKQFRSGIVVGPFFEYTYDSDKYRGKAHHEDFGGKGIEDIYRSTIGFTADFPLGRGRGARSAAAPERAARIDWEASRHSVAHTASLGLLETIGAYWDLVAAEQAEQVLEQSERLQSEIVEHTQTLIDADEVPASELSRARAQHANALAALENARRRSLEARIALSHAMGLASADEYEAPGASDDFPEALAEDALADYDPRPLLDGAPHRRHDSLAAAKLEESGGVLAEAARRDLRPLADLGTRYFYNSAEERSGTDALGGRYVGPSYNLALNVEWPFRNNTQKGLYQQALAAQEAGTIRRIDLERRIRLGIVQALGSLSDSLARLAYAGKAADFYAKALEAEVERFQFGTATLIDTLVTEQRLTEARLSLVDAQQQYAELLARLRFESGTLVTELDSGSFVVDEGFLGLPSFDPTTATAATTSTTTTSAASAAAGR